MTSQTSSASISENYHALRRRVHGMVALVAVVLLALFALSLTVGSSDLGIQQSLAALLGFGDQDDITAVRTLRLPRAMTAVITGVGLALAGAALQSTLENPLASSSTVGIAQGAAFGATVSMLVLPSALSAIGLSSGGGTTVSMSIVALSAFMGALISAVVVLLFSRISNTRPETIVLAGVALSALFAGTSAIIQYFADDVELSRVIFWQFGDLGRASWMQIALIAIVTAGAGVYFLSRAWDYNALQNGAHTAWGLGVDVKVTRIFGVLVSALTAATIVSVVGLINFIGLISPHIARRLVGSDYRDLLPASALVGACVMLASDIVARVVLSPIILPIGAITSIIGAPVFLWLLLRGARKGGFGR